MTLYKITKTAHERCWVCELLADKAIVYARVTGSVGGSHTETIDGVEHSVTVRKPVWVTNDLGDPYYCGYSVVQVRGPVLHYSVYYAGEQVARFDDHFAAKRWAEAQTVAWKPNKADNGFWCEVGNIYETEGGWAANTVYRDLGTYVTQELAAQAVERWG